MTDKLKPCPFCNSEKVGTASCHPLKYCSEGVFKEDANTTNWQVICSNCGASTDVVSSKSNAKRKWNRRADNER